MALYTIADLHLSIAHPEKTMNVFGVKWDHYEEKLKERWSRIVSASDTVILPGDISWAGSLLDSKADFAFLNELPGKKLIGKGNHDFWWSTSAKVNAFWKEHGFDTLHILFNNAFLIEDRIICGTRGWFFDEGSQNTVSKTDFEKLCNRELLRLQHSLDEGVKLRESVGKDLPIYVFLHFPPIWGDEKCENLLSLLTTNSVQRCYYGHIHGFYRQPAVREYRGIPMELVASDHLDFCPLLVR